MDIELYNKKREELTGLLNELLVELKGINDEYAYLDFRELEPAQRDIEDISRRVYENIFKIMLVARFQGGKSTSFNAMLGGSCYSPMGNAAIKCSAAAITAQHTLDKNKVGATIVVRSPAELQSLIEEAGLDFDASDSSALKDAQEAWTARFNAWKENPRVFNEKERDFLFICGLILAYYDDPKIQKLLSAGKFEVSLDDVGKYAKFPENYLVRYSTSGAKDFSLEEVLFAFVHRIDCRTQSGHLERIGALIEDCPGLFANAFDTTLTFQEMADANAVWYLFNARAPEESDIRAIKACMEICRDRVFFSANIKDCYVAKPMFVERIFPTIKTEIKNLTGESIDVHPYHALGALLCMQGEAYLRNNGRFENKSVESYLVSACKDRGFESTDPAECWRALARVTIMGMYPMGHPAFMKVGDPLSAEGVEILRAESHWAEITNAIQNYVISTKARSILVTDSSEKAISLVDSLAKILQTREDAALKNEEIVTAEFNAAEEQLKKFEEFAARRMHSLNGDGGEFVDQQLADDLFKTAFLENVDEIATAAAPGILEESELFSIGLSKVAQIAKNGWNWLRSKFKGTNYTHQESSYVVSCKGIIQGAIQEAATGKIASWVTSAVDGCNPEFCRLVTDPAKRICRDLKDEWKHTCKEDAVLANLTPVFPDPPDVWVITSDPLGGAGSAAAGAGTKFAVKEFMTDLMVCTAVGTGGCLIFGVMCGEPITMVVSAALLLVKKLFSDRSKHLKAIQDSIAQELPVGFYKSKDALVEHFSKQLAPLRKQVAKNVFAPVQEVKKQFEVAKAAALADLEKSRDERKKIAADCKAIRERIMADGKSYQQIQEFVDSTKSYFDK